MKPVRTRTGEDEVLIGCVGSPTRVRGQARIFPKRHYVAPGQRRSYVGKREARCIYNAVLNCCP